MSIWGPAPYENDDAADWLADLSEAPSVVAVNDAFDDVLGAEADQFLEVTECANAVAAAAIAAYLFDGDNTVELDPESLDVLSDQFSRMLPSARQSLGRRAVRVLGVITNWRRSELRQLMNEDPQTCAGWDASVEDLIRRLALGAGWSPSTT